MVIPGWSSTCAPAIKLRNLAMKLLPASFLDSCVNQKESIPPLQFPPVDNLLPALLQNPQVPQLSKSSFIEALQVHLLGVRAQTIHKIWLALLSRAEALVQQSRSISTTSQATSPLSSSASSTKPRGRAPKFTKEQTAALNALLARATQYSSEDKELIAHELNLTRDQVNRWFCNARARKKPYTCPSRRAGPTTKTILSSNNSTRSDSPSTQSERSYSQGSPQSSSSEDTEMSITNTSSPSPSSSSSSLSTSPSSSSYLSTSSTTPVEDDPMEAYFDFPAYQPTETWPQQNQQQQDTPYLQPLPSQLNYQQRQHQALLPLPSQQNYYHHPFDQSLPYNSVSGSSSCDESSQFSNHSSSPSNSNIGQGLWNDDLQQQLPPDFNFTPFVCS
ncbi:hypothetical protein Pst134EA_031296 [Puccinia striiformis f. sp. tritici]|uniref:uncharacterized protein n=1 Tax=Puccinia striiformis f. sp. tritici TaxID=168172 RepID=UPI002008EB90|nr:uncharacterized protein Pst134EA_031296 [Puccinia striiformis f. sp. tritici]KAH9443394.1 hypothetical protein Pst134EA_031296 [Puccinia striiformis f. sp. tritici]